MFHSIDALSPLMLAYQGFALFAITSLELFYLLLLLLRQDPLDLSFWSFLTFLHHGIEDVDRHLL